MSAPTTFIINEVLHLLGLFLKTQQSLDLERLPSLPRQCSKKKLLPSPFAAMSILVLSRLGSFVLYS